VVRDWALTKDDGQDWESFWKVEEEKRALDGAGAAGPRDRRPGFRVQGLVSKAESGIRGVGWVQCAVLRCGIGPGMVPVGLQRALPHR
jgi:hypothetical protein